MDYIEIANYVGLMWLVGFPILLLCQCLLCAIVSCYRDSISHGMGICLGILLVIEILLWLAFVVVFVAFELIKGMDTNSPKNGTP